MEGYQYIYILNILLKGKPFQTLQIFWMSGRAWSSFTLTMPYWVRLNLLSMHFKIYNILKLQFLYFHIELPPLSWASLFHLHLSQSHSYASIPKQLNTGDVGGGGRGVVEMTNLEHQNPQSVVVMPSSGWYEHYLVCRRVLTIFRGKGRIRQFTIPPKLPTQNPAQKCPIFR